MTRKKKNGLTLIQLLIIGAIVALILSIVIPIIYPCCPPATKIICLANMHYLSVGFLLYHEENNLYPITSWCDQLKPIVSDDERNPYQCPKDETGPCSYAMNENIPADATDLPPDLVIFFESTPGWNQVGDVDDVITDRHGKPGANIGFADGSVEFIEAEEIGNLRWTIEQALP